MFDKLRAHTQTHECFIIRHVDAWEGRRWWRGPGSRCRSGLARERLCLRGARADTSHPSPPGPVQFQALLLEILAASQRTNTDDFALSQEGRRWASAPGMVSLLAACLRPTPRNRFLPTSSPGRQPGFSFFVLLFVFLCFCLFLSEA